MTAKVFTTMQMEVKALTEPEVIVPMTVVKHDEGTVEIVLSGKYKSVSLDPEDVAALNTFLRASEVFQNG